MTDNVTYLPDPKKVKAHFKKYQAEYVFGAIIVGGGIAIGVAVGVGVYKAQNGVVKASMTAREMYSVGGTAVHLPLTRDEARIYNTLTDILKESIKKGTKLNAHPKDVEVYNRIAAMTNAVLATLPPIHESEVASDYLLKVSK